MRIFEVTADMRSLLLRTCCLEQFANSIKERCYESARRRGARCLRAL